MDFGVKVENVVIETIGEVVPDQLFIANFEDNFDFDNLVYVNQVKNEKIIEQDSDVLCKIFRYLPQRMKLFLIVLYIIRKIDTPLPQAILPDIDQEDKPLREKRSNKSRKRRNPDYVYDHWDNTELAYEATDHTEDDGANWLNDSKLESDREECDVCSKPFKSKTRLKTHMKKFHGIESILTKIENEENIEGNLEELEDDKGWIGHSRKTGKKSGRQKCPICPSKSFKGKKYLVNHMKKSHGNDAFETDKLSERTCTQCQKEFTNKSVLARHIKTVHEQERPFKCDHCLKHFFNNNQLQEHIKTIHEGIRNYQCEVCSHQFSRPNRLKEHIETVHEGKTYQCEKCGKELSSRGYHKIHVETCGKYPEEIEQKIPKKAKKLVCPICPNYSKVFPNRESFDVHIKNMHKEIKCEDCPEVFIDFGKYRRHCAKIHKGKKYTQCPVCKKEIREMWIQRHQKKCEVENVCPLCHKSFKKNYLMKKHFELIHEGKKSYQCHQCAHLFATKAGLIHHQQHVHEGIKFHCQVCDQAYASKGHLKSHLQITHVPRVEELLKCESCTEFCVGFDLYKLHVEQTHPGTKVRRKGNEICPHCSKDLCSKQKLERHIKAVHLKEKNFKCDQCIFASALKQGLENHIKSVHLKERNHSCAMCSNQYFDKRDLAKHIERHHSNATIYVKTTPQPVVAVKRRKY